MFQPPSLWLLFQWRDKQMRRFRSCCHPAESAVLSTTTFRHDHHLHPTWTRMDGRSAGSQKEKKVQYLKCLSRGNPWGTVFVTIKSRFLLDYLSVPCWLRIWIQPGPAWCCAGRQKRNHNGWSMARNHDEAPSSWLGRCLQSRKAG